MSIGLAVMQYVSSSTNSVQTVFYTNMAKEAANAGASMAYNCLRASGQINTAPWQGHTLRPNTTCDGTTLTHASASPYLQESHGTSTLRTTFEVAGNTSIVDVSNSGAKITSIGRVEFLYAGSTTPTRTIEQRTVVNIPFNLAAANIPVPQGRAVTQISSGLNFHCTVANQELYCWGGNEIGQLGLDECLVGVACGGTYSGPRLSPTRVNGKHIANKRVDSVSAGGIAGCAVAEGRGHCWGTNSSGQIGNGDTTFLEFFHSIFPFNPFDILYLGFDDLLAAQRYRPTLIRGELENSNVTKIDYGWVVGAVPDRQAVCGLSNGKIYCWGANNYGQLGQPRYNNAPAGSSGQICAPPFNWPCAPLPFSAQECNGWQTATNTILGFYTYVTQYLCSAPASTTPNSFFTVDANEKTPKAVWGFGNRHGGQPGYEQNTSVALFAGKRAHDVAVGAAGTCAVIDGGQVHCWGDLTLGLGLPSASSTNFGLTTKTTNSQKQGTLGSLKATQVALGSATGCALAQGSTHCWGRIRGNGADSNNNTPTLAQTPTGTILDSINMSGELAGFICATGRGNGYCWGKRIPVSGQNYLSPIEIAGGNLGLPNSKITSAGTGAGNDPSEGLLPGFFGNPGNTCIITNATVYCAGNNTYGQLGRGNTAPSDYTYVRTTNDIGLTAGEAATSIAAGNNYSCAVINAQPFCWGANSRGQLGVGSQTNQHTPTSVFDLTDDSTTAIDAGDNHTCSITNGQVYCWGDNTNGKLGTGAANPQTTPRLVTEGGISANGMAATDVAAGNNHTCAVISGSAWCWGENGNGQLGRGNTSSTNASTPQQVGGLLAGKLVTKITAGNNFTCAVADGLPYCWGLNSNGQLGDGTTTQRTSPVLVANMPGTTTDIQAGSNFACAIEGGYVKCWGENGNGQLGRGNTANNASMRTPQTVGTINSQNTTDLSVGDTHACSLSNGRGYCWGSRTEGKGGINPTTTSGNSTTATAIQEATGAMLLGETNKPFAITAGNNHSCAIANAKIFCWGRNTEGQLGDSSTTQRNTPTVSANYSRNVAEVAWGDTVFY